MQVDNDVETFKQVMARFVTGVTVMTTVVDGVPHGMTANAFTSVSLDPLLVLVCVQRGSVMAKSVEDSGVFGVTLLSQSQEAMSNHFANSARPFGHEEFAGFPFVTRQTGSPLLEGGLGWVDCRVAEILPGGDHLVVIGEVVALELTDGLAPLIYYRSGYVDVTGPAWGEPADK